MHTLSLYGRPRIMGQKHGETFRKEIQQLARIRRDLLKTYLQEMHMEEMEELSHKQLSILQEHGKLCEEFYGIAEGANISLVDLIILNNYTDLRDFSYPKQETSEEGGCTLFSIRAPQLVCWGQTWDMHASAEPFVLHLHYTDHPQTHILTVTGCLALCGINEYGVSIMINNMHCKETAMGLIWPALINQILRKSKKAQDAFQYLKKHLPCSGHNYLISDSEHTLNIETTGRRWMITQELKKENGVLFHTNHYVSDLKSAEILLRQSPTTHTRFEALERYFQTHELHTHTSLKLKEDLLGAKAAPVLSPSDPKTPEDGKTCGGFFYDASIKKGLFFAKTFFDNDHRDLVFQKLSK